MALGLNAVKASVFRRSQQQALTGPEQTTRYAGGADFIFPHHLAPNPKAASIRQLWTVHAAHTLGDYVEQCQNELERAVAAQKPGKGASHE